MAPNPSNAPGTQVEYHECHETLPPDADALQRLYDDLEAQGAAWHKGTRDLEKHCKEKTKAMLAEREQERAAFVKRKGRVFHALQAAKAFAAAEAVGMEVLNEAETVTGTEAVTVESEPAPDPADPPPADDLTQSGPPAAPPPVDPPPDAAPPTSEPANEPPAETPPTETRRRRK